MCAAASAHLLLHRNPDTDKVVENGKRCESVTVNLKEGVGRIRSMPLCSDSRVSLKKLPPQVGAFLQHLQSHAKLALVRQSKERVWPVIRYGLPSTID